MRRLTAVVCAGALLCLSAWMFTSCEKEKYSPTPYEITIPRYFPTALNIPADNPLTEEGIALGEKLFHDPIISGEPSEGLCCASCHVKSAGYDLGGDNPRLENGRPRGAAGVTHHNALPLCNLVFNRQGYLWNGSVAGEKNIEDIVRTAITLPEELNASEDQVVAAISADAGYREMFRKAFGDEEVTMDRISKAIAQYVRTLISAESKFDHYLRGEATLTDAELRGYILFTTEEGADCFHCHGSAGTPLFTTNLFYNNALTAHPEDPMDRFSVTGDEMDHGCYRAPTLRNIAVTAPYMHDGRFNTLDEVLDFYNSGLQSSPYASPLMHKLPDGGACLTPSQIADLKAFLNTLTDEKFIQE